MTYAIGHLYESASWVVSKLTEVLPSIAGGNNAPTLGVIAKMKGRSERRLFSEHPTVSVVLIARDAPYRVGRTREHPTGIVCVPRQCRRALVMIQLDRDQTAVFIVVKTEVPLFYFLCDARETTLVIPVDREPM